MSKIIGFGIEPDKREDSTKNKRWTVEDYMFGGHHVKLDHLLEIYLQRLSKAYTKVVAEISRQSNGNYSDSDVIRFRELKQALISNTKEIITLNPIREQFIKYLISYDLNYNYNTAIYGREDVWSEMTSLVVETLMTVAEKYELAITSYELRELLESLESHVTEVTLGGEKVIGVNLFELTAVYFLDILADKSHKYLEGQLWYINRGLRKSNRTDTSVKRANTILENILMRLPTGETPLAKNLRNHADLEELIGKPDKIVEILNQEITFQTAYYHKSGYSTLGKDLENMYDLAMIYLRRYWIRTLFINAPTAFHNLHGNDLYGRLGFDEALRDMFLTVSRVDISRLQVSYPEDFDPVIQEVMEYETKL